MTLKLSLCICTKGTSAFGPDKGEPESLFLVLKLLTGVGEQFLGSPLSGPKAMVPLVQTHRDNFSVRYEYE